MNVTGPIMINWLEGKFVAIIKLDGMMAKFSNTTPNLVSTMSDLRTKVKITSRKRTSMDKK